METASLDFISFLKYGALGVALALAILSYRLLSREQEKKEVREPILRSIKTYFIFSIVLSVFFGTTEFFGKPSRNEIIAEEAINDIWEEHFQGLNDTTVHQKAVRIKRQLKDGTAMRKLSDECKTYKDSLALYKTKLAEMKQGFYPSITRLRKEVDNDPDGWINMKFNPDEKKEIYSLVENIFITLGDFSETGHTAQDVTNKWKSFKEQRQLDKPEYIFRSDIPQVVRQYLDEFHSGK